MAAKRGPSSAESKSLCDVVAAPPSRPGLARALVACKRLGCASVITKRKRRATRIVTIEQEGAGNEDLSPRGVPPNEQSSRPSRLRLGARAIGGQRPGECARGRERARVRVARARSRARVALSLGGGLDLQTCIADGQSDLFQSRPRPAKARAHPRSGRKGSAPGGVGGMRGRGRLGARGRDDVDVRKGPVRTMWAALEGVGARAAAACAALQNARKARRRGFASARMRLARRLSKQTINRSPPQPRERRSDRQEVPIPPLRARDLSPRDRDAGGLLRAGGHPTRWQRRDERLVSDPHVFGSVVRPARKERAAAESAGSRRPPLRSELVNRAGCPPCAERAATAQVTVDPERVRRGGRALRRDLPVVVRGGPGVAAAAGLFLIRDLRREVPVSCRQRRDAAVNAKLSSSCPGGGWHMEGCRRPRHTRG